MNTQKNKLLSELSTFGIGGPAREFVEVRQIHEMQSALKHCKDHQLPFLIIGKGSNCLFDDRGFNGCVILNKIDFHENPSPGVYHVGAGYSFSLLGVQTARNGWSGLEFASGIPASIGGAVFMNAGANGKETCESLTSVDFVTPNSELLTLPKSDLHFAYRTSSFQTMKGAIVGATFTLQPSTEARQKQIEIVKYRQKTQPYSDKSAGCIFRNPANGFAGQLIEQTGLKGHKVGGAEVSSMHANFIVNKAQARAQDVLELIAAIQLQVSTNTGIHLESEVRYVPYE